MCYYFYIAYYPAAKLEQNIVKNAWWTTSAEYAITVIRKDLVGGLNITVLGPCNLVQNTTLWYRQLYTDIVQWVGGV